MTAPRLTPDLLLRAYASGIFPMARSAEDERVYWVDPELRGVIPIDRFHLSRSLRRTILRAPYPVTLNRDFAGVVRGCGDREETWINPPIFAAYEALHEADHAHSIELWDGDELVGGVYGVTLGRAFFGESMFSRRRDASKIALATLVAHLRQTGFTLFDTQFLTEHLASLGAEEIERSVYRERLAEALSEGDADITARALPDPYSVVQLVTQTS